MSKSNSEYLSVAIQAALQAGELLKRGFGTKFAIDVKPGKHNLVTEYDKAAEKSIIAAILKAFPTHGILAEESGKSKAGEVTWIIDPLDGTLNFARSVPIFSVSIGVALGKELEKEMVCGVVFQPMTGELFWAEKGKGAFLNGQPLHVRSTSLLEEACVATGFPYNVHEDPLKCIETFDHFARLGVPIRRLGSAAIDMAYVAAGRFDAYWEVTLQPWDFAAGKLLVEEAGGKVTRYDGSPLDLFVAGTTIASNGLLHSRMIKEING